MKQNGNGGGRPPVAVEVGRYLGHGLTWVASTVVFMLAGRWLDGRVGTAPWLALVGAFVGAVAGFWSMYYHLVIEPGREDRGRRE